MTANVLYKRGTKMYWKSTGVPAYEKVDDDEFGWWVSLTSTYVVTKMVNGEKVDEVRPESEKPLYKADKSLNRFGFRWTDKQVEEYYKDMMNFVFP